MYGFEERAAVVPGYPVWFIPVLSLFRYRSEVSTIFRYVNTDLYTGTLYIPVLIGSVFHPGIARYYYSRKREVNPIQDTDRSSSIRSRMSTGLVRRNPVSSPLEGIVITKADEQ